MDKHESKYSFEDLIEIMAKLRSENGCPWDKEQTHESLTNCLIE
jgi:tetrapyrrole methylase family protein / MazG family protein